MLRGAVGEVGGVGAGFVDSVAAREYQETRVFMCIWRHSGSGNSREVQAKPAWRCPLGVARRARRKPDDSSKMRRRISNFGKTGLALTCPECGMRDFPYGIRPFPTPDSAISRLKKNKSMRDVEATPLPLGPSWAGAFSR